MNARGVIQKDSWILKFVKNPMGILSFALLVLATVLALLAYVIAPDNSPNANSMHLSIAAKPPGYSVLMFLAPTDQNIDVSSWKTLIYGSPKAFVELPITAFKQIPEGIEVTLLQADSDGTTKKIFTEQELTKGGTKFQKDFNSIF